MGNDFCFNYWFVHDNSRISDAGYKSDFYWRSFDEQAPRLGDENLSHDDWRDFNKLRDELFALVHFDDVAEKIDVIRFDKFFLASDSIADTIFSAKT